MRIINRHFILKCIDQLMEADDVSIIVKKKGKAIVQAMFYDGVVITYTFDKPFFQELYFGLPAWFVRKYFDTPEIRYFLTLK